MQTSKARVLLWSCAAGFAVLSTAAFVWMRVLHRGPPPGIMKDIRAGLVARDIEDPDERVAKYLEERYGTLSDPLHRQEAFMDFFNVEHIRALQLLVKHSPEMHRQANVDAMARWVAAYRSSLTSEERQALKAQIQTPEGQVMLRRATAQYNSQDVRYRGSTAPVISQLLRTLNEVEQGR
jgi:hypothetical protein